MILVVDYEGTDVDDIKHIHKFLIKKKDIVQMKIFRFVQKVFFIELSFIRFYKCEFIKL